MSGSTFGKLFKVTTWGESHGKALGAVIDGCPAGLPLSEENIQIFLDRRKPGANPFGTSRSENDRAEILSGVFDGKTTGTPISVIVYNNDQRSHDYDTISKVYRPGHADYTFDSKYGFRDYRGGGRTSGRETIGRVIGGAVASKLLSLLNINIQAYTKAVGSVCVPESEYDYREIQKNPLYMPNHDYYLKAAAFLDECKKNQDSAGGIAECRVTGLPAGLGEPVFDKLDACLAKAVLSIGAVKGFEIGDGFRAARSLGSENNDPFIIRNGKIVKASNHSGGTLGGLSDGDTLIFRAAFKPTPSISLEQHSVNTCNEAVTLSIKGRHDPIIVPRAIVVIESMTAITLADLILENLNSRTDHILKIYPAEN